jgi:hypothetical protein
MSAFGGRADVAYQGLSGPFLAITGNSSALICSFFVRNIPGRGAWDHASVLIQLGVLDAERLPALGSEQTQRLLYSDVDANRPVDCS